MSEKREHGQKIKRQAAGSIWSVASNILSRGAGFLFTPIFTSLLTPKEFGVYSVYVSILGIMTVIITFEMAGGFMYRALVKFKGRESELLSSLFGLAVVLTLIFLSLYIIFHREINALTSLGFTLTVILIVQIFLNVAEGLYFARERFFSRFRRISVINISRGVLTPILSLALIRLGVREEARILSPLIISLLISFPIIYVILKNGKKLYSKSVWRYMIGILLPMLPNYLSLSLIAQSEKIIISKLLGAAAVGKYSAAYSVGSLLSLFASGVSMALVPWIARVLGDGGGERVKKAITLSTRLIAFLTLLFLSVLPEVFAIIIAKAYREAIGVAYLTALSVLFSFLASIMQNVMLFYERPGLITRNSLICAGLSLSLTIFTVKRGGYVGGAFTTLISYMLLFLFNYISVYRLSRGKLIDGRAVTGYALFMLSFSALIFLFRGEFFSRIFFLIAILMIFLPKAREYKKIIFR